MALKMSVWDCYDYCDFPLFTSNTEEYKNCVDICLAARLAHMYVSMEQTDVKEISDYLERIGNDPEELKKEVDKMKIIKCN